MFEAGAEGHEGVLHTLGLGLGEVSVGLDFPVDVLELSLQLLFGLDALEQHDVVVLVHLVELGVHLLEGHVVVLLRHEVAHVLVDEVALGDKVLVVGARG